MVTQIIFTIDPKIKAQAMKRAKREGVPFASVLKMATKAFAVGELSIGLSEEIRPEKLKQYEQRSRRMDAGEGMRFADIKEFRKYLRKL